jgi:hypothetical protein
MLELLTRNLTHPVLGLLTAPWIYSRSAWLVERECSRAPKALRQTRRTVRDALRANLSPARSFE